MADEIDESAETFSEDAWCPYCEKLRRYDAHGCKLLKTCGDRVCHCMAITAGMRERTAREANESPVPRLSMCAGEIDFKKGFASQNLIFAEDYARLRPR